MLNPLSKNITLVAAWKLWKSGWFFYADLFYDNVLLSTQYCSQSKKKKKTDFIPYRDSVLTWLLRENLGNLLSRALHFPMSIFIFFPYFPWIVAYSKARELWGRDAAWCVKLLPHCILENGSCNFCFKIKLLVGMVLCKECSVCIEDTGWHPNILFSNAASRGSDFSTADPPQAAVDIALKGPPILQSPFLILYRIIVGGWSRWNQHFY